MNLGEKESDYFQMLLSSKKTRSRQKLNGDGLSRNYYNRGERDLGIELTPN